MNYIRPDSGVARSKLNSMVTVFSVYTTYTCTVASEKKAAEECRNMQIMVVPFFLFCLVTILLLFFPQYSLSLSLSLSLHLHFNLHGERTLTLSFMHIFFCNVTLSIFESKKKSEGRMASCMAF